MTKYWLSIKPHACFSCSTVFIPTTLYLIIPLQMIFSLKRLFICVFRWPWVCITMWNSASRRPSALTAQKQQLRSAPSWTASSPWVKINTSHLFYFIWTEFPKWEILITLLDEITSLWLLQSGGYQFLSLQAKSSDYSQASSKDVF